MSGDLVVMRDNLITRERRSGRRDVSSRRALNHSIVLNRALRAGGGPQALRELWPGCRSTSTSTCEKLEQNVFAQCRVVVSKEMATKLMDNPKTEGNVQIAIEGYCLTVPASALSDVMPAFDSVRANADIISRRLTYYCKEEDKYNAAFADTVDEDVQVEAECAVCDALCAWLPLNNLLEQTVGVRTLYGAFNKEAQKRGLVAGGKCECETPCTQQDQTDAEDSSKCTGLFHNGKCDPSWCFVKNACDGSTKGTRGEWAYCGHDIMTEEARVQAELQRIDELKSVLASAGEDFKTEMEELCMKSPSEQETLLCNMPTHDVNLALILLKLKFVPMPYAMRENIGYTLDWLHKKLNHLFESPVWCKEIDASITVETKRLGWKTGKTKDVFVGDDWLTKKISTLLVKIRPTILNRVAKLQGFENWDKLLQTIKTLREEIRKGNPLTWEKINELLPLLGLIEHLCKEDKTRELVNSILNNEGGSADSIQDELNAAVLERKTLVQQVKDKMKHSIAHAKDNAKDFIAKKLTNIIVGSVGKLSNGASCNTCTNSWMEKNKDRYIRYYGTVLLKPSDVENASKCSVGSV